MREEVSPLDYMLPVVVDKEINSDTDAWGLCLSPTPFIAVSLYFMRLEMNIQVWHDGVTAFLKRFQRTSAKKRFDRYFKSTRTDGGLVSWWILLNRISCFFFFFLLGSAQKWRFGNRFGWLKSGYKKAEITRNTSSHRLKCVLYDPLTKRRMLWTLWPQCSLMDAVILFFF